MKYKCIILFLLIGLLVSCQTEEVLPPLVPQFGKLFIFDGGQVYQGKGYALPRGISEWSVSYEHPYINKKHLHFDLQFNQGWTGCGWNWNAWNGEGNNIKGFQNLSFYIVVSPSAMSNMTFQLTSKNKAGGPDGMGPKVAILPAINKRGKYVKVEIPVKKLIGGTLDDTSVWGFNIGVFSSKADKNGPVKKGKSRSCQIDLDLIEFTQ